MTFGPFTHSSPRPPGPTSSSVAGSTSLHSTLGSAKPDELRSRSGRSSGMQWLTGDSSVIP